MSRTILIAVAAFGVLTTAATAQTLGDASYCRALIEKYRTVTGGTQNNEAVAAAIEQCNKDNPSAGIPVLEKALQDSKTTLPPRN